MIATSQNLRLCKYAHSSSGEKVPQCPTSDAHSLFSQPLEVRWSGTYVRVCDCSSEHTWTLSDSLSFSITGRLFSTSPRRSSLSWPTDPRSHPTTWSRYVRSWWPLRHSGKPWLKSTWKKRLMPSSKRPGEWQKPGLWASSPQLPGQATFNYTQFDNFTIFFTKAVSRH